MADEKICPLSMSIDYRYSLVPCLHKRCAWWDEDAQMCAILTIAKGGSGNGEPYEEPVKSEQSDRDRIIQLLQEARTKHLTIEVADYLIENGVTFRGKLP